MSDGTFLAQNSAYEGASIYLETFGREYSPQVSYTLPAPLGHFLQIWDDGRVSTVNQPIIDDDYPFKCAVQRYGNATLPLSVQSSPRCSGLCPAGHYCPQATVQPLLCGLGRFCPQASGVELLCPVGTYGATKGLASALECTPCAAGTACSAGSPKEERCAPGTYSSIPESGECADCEPGTFQNAWGQTSCKT
jgi:hypothetical protein